MGVQIRAYRGVLFQALVIARGGAQADQILASSLNMNSFPCGSFRVHGNVT